MTNAASPASEPVECPLSHHGAGLVSMAAEPLRLDREGATAVWTIDRPTVRNALDTATFEALVRAIEDAKRDRHLRAIVLTGAGAAFVSGGDLRELRSRTTRTEAERLSDRGRRVCDGIAGLQVPVIAAVAGPAIGGGAELALACDIRIGDSRARFSFKHARLAVTTAWGVLPKLVATVGHGAASRLLLTGQEVNAEEALRIGLLESVVDEGTSLTTAVGWARQVAEGGPKAVAALKRLLHDAGAAGRRPLLARERSAFIASWISSDHKEAVSAFFEGRRATWSTR